MDDSITVDLNSWTITIGEKPAGVITRIGPGEGRITVCDAFYEYRVYGPFGQGYNIGLVSGGAEIATVSYCWREGAVISIRNPNKEFDFNNGSLFEGGRKIGKGFSKSDKVLIRLEENLEETQEQEIILLMALDVMYAERIGVFLRGLK